MGLKVLLVLILDIQSRLGPIYEIRSQVLELIAVQDTHNTVTVCVVVIGCFCIAVLITVLVIQPLSRLMRGMNSLVLLDIKTADQLMERGSFFTEIRACQTSFVALIRLHLLKFLYFCLFCCV
jgi:hypothetical protein